MKEESKHLEVIRSDTRKRVVKNIVNKPYDEAMKAINDLEISSKSKSPEKEKQLLELLSIAEKMVQEKRDQEKKQLLNIFKKNVKQIIKSMK